MIRRFGQHSWNQRGSWISRMVQVGAVRENASTLTKSKPKGQNPPTWRVAKKHHVRIRLSVKILTAFRPQCPGSIRFPNWAGEVYAFDIQTC
jgi:hypothetical protein